MLNWVGYGLAEFHLNWDVEDIGQNRNTSFILIEHQKRMKKRIITNKCFLNLSLSLIYIYIYICIYIYIYNIYMSICIHIIYNQFNVFIT